LIYKSIFRYSLPESKADVSIFHDSADGVAELVYAALSRVNVVPMEYDDAAVELNTPRPIAKLVLEFLIYVANSLPIRITPLAGNELALFTVNTFCEELVTAWLKVVVTVKLELSAFVKATNFVKSDIAVTPEEAPVEYQFELYEPSELVDKLNPYKPDLVDFKLAIVFTVLSVLFVPRLISFKINLTFDLLGAIVLRYIKLD
jgi:hypothetical protein